MITSKTVGTRRIEQPKCNGSFAPSQVWFCPVLGMNGFCGCQKLTVIASTPQGYVGGGTPTCCTDKSSDGWVAKQEPIVSTIATRVVHNGIEDLMAVVKYSCLGLDLPQCAISRLHNRMPRICCYTWRRVIKLVRRCFRSSRRRFEFKALWLSRWQSVAIQICQRRWMESEEGQDTKHKQASRYYINICFNATAQLEYPHISFISLLPPKHKIYVPGSEVSFTLITPLLARVASSTIVQTVAVSFDDSCIRKHGRPFITSIGWETTWYDCSRFTW